MNYSSTRASRSAWRQRLNWFLGLCYILVLIATCTARAQTAPDASSGVVVGRVSNQRTGTALPNARVSVVDGNAETVTDANGTYRLTGVPAGAVRIMAEYVGLASLTGSVQVGDGESVSLDFEMDSTTGQTSTAEGKTVVLEKFEVLSDREESAQQRAMNQQRQSPNIKNVVAYDEFPTPGDDNIGDYMRYIPGLSVIYSGRAATDAQIRGLPSDTSSITVDGLALSGAGTSGSRSVSLLSVPTANIATIEVTKVPTPDMPAHGLGGSINITTKSGFERTKPLFTYDVFTSFDPDLGFDKRPVPDDFIGGRPVRPSFRVSYVHPFNRSLSISVNASQQNTYSEPRTGVVTYDLVRGLPSAVSFAAGYQSVTVNTARIGVDWKLGDMDIFGVSYSFREREADQATPTITATFGAGATGDASSVTGAAGGVGTLSDAGTWESLYNDTRQVDFKYTHLGSDWKIDVGASHSTSGFYFLPQLERGYLGASKTVSTAGTTRINGRGINSLADTPEEMLGTIEAFSRTGAPLAFNDAGIYSVTTVGARDWSNEVAKTQVRLDAKRELETFIPLTVRAGVSWTSEGQEVKERSRTWAFRTGQTAAVRQASNYDVIDRGFTTPGIFGAEQTWTSGAKLFDLMQTTPSYFTENEATGWQTRVNASKELEEEISAAYIRLDSYLLQKRLWLVAGLRYERTEDYGEGPLVDPTAQFVRNANGSLARTPAGALIPITTDPLQVAKLVFTERGINEKTTYDGFFPSLNATYNIAKDLLLRAGYARTIGRPNLPFIIPGITYGTVSAITNTQTITVVNNRLKPWTADNIDVSLEAYMIKGGFGSVGVFQKNISNFFLATSEEGTTERLADFGIFPGVGNDIFYTIVTRANGGDARVRGFELSYRQNLVFLPKWASGIQVFINYTRSELGGSTTADFTGFNPETLSYGASIARKRFVVKFNATEQGETKRSAVAQSATIPADVYQYQGALRRYVLSGEFRLRKSVSIYGQWGDFNNSNGYVDVQKRFSEATPEALRGFRVANWGQSVVIGVKGSF